MPYPISDCEHKNLPNSITNPDWKGSVDYSLKEGFGEPPPFKKDGNLTPGTTFGIIYQDGLRSPTCSPRSDVPPLFVTNQISVIAPAASQSTGSAGGSSGGAAVFNPPPSAAPAPVAVSTLPGPSGPGPGSDISMPPPVSSKNPFKAKAHVARAVSHPPGSKHLGGKQSGITRSHSQSSQGSVTSSKAEADFSQQLQNFEDGSQLSQKLNSP